MELTGIGSANQRKAIADGIAASLDVIKSSGVSAKEANDLFTYTQWVEMMGAFAESGKASTILLPSGFEGSSSLLPDILAGDVVRIPYWASEGIFTDITKQIDGLDNKADLQQGHIEAGTVDGAEYTLPFITDVSVMVWNKNLYKEAGLDPEQDPKRID